MVDILSSYLSLVLTFLAIGLGYISILLGYALAGKTKDFFEGEKLKSTDKMTLSFIIGALSFIVLTSTFNIGMESLERSIINILIYDMTMIAGFSIFIAYLLGRKGANFVKVPQLVKQRKVKFI